MMTEFIKIAFILSVVVALFDSFGGISLLQACSGDETPVPRCGCSSVVSELVGTEAKILYQGWGYPKSVEVNSYDAECFPWISGNGQYLLFGSINFNGPHRPGHIGGWDLYRSEWDSINNCWGIPLNFGPVINTNFDERRPCCNASCDTLYFQRKGINNNFNIYMSAWNGNNWTPVESLGDPVNSYDNDEHPALSADGMRLYFTSDRPGGLGGRDIWVAFWNGTAWDSAVNIGPPVNTPNEETRPFESYDRQRLYFTNQHGEPRVEGSYGGGGDIYVSTWTGSGWGLVSLVAAPVNNDLLACSPYETPDGNTLYFGSEAWEGARGDEDLWVAKKNTIFPPDTTTGYGQWIKTGELTGAIIVYDIAEGPGGVLYAATACADTAPMGKVFKTYNDGQNWAPCADFPPGTMTVYSLLVVNDTVYAATYPNGDVFKSFNGGSSWMNTADLPGITSVRDIIRLQNGDLLAGTSPHNIQHHNRIFRSTDGGLTWNVTASLFGINPCKALYQASSGSIFAGGWGIDSRVTISRSTDNGATWDSITVVPAVQCEWSVDAFFEASDHTMYVTGWFPAETVGIGGGFVYRSDDDGLTWQACSKIMRGDGVHNCRVYTMADDVYGRLYVGMQPAYDSVVFFTTDSGDTWHSAGGLDGVFECLCLLRASDGALYAGTTPNGDVFRYMPVGIEERLYSSPPATYLTSFPNPGHGNTTMRFSVRQSQHVSLKVYDASGRIIRVLKEGAVKRGEYQMKWDGSTAGSDKTPSGVYFCELKADGGTYRQKMILLMP